MCVKVVRWLCCATKPNSMPHRAHIFRYACMWHNESKSDCWHHAGRPSPPSANDKERWPRYSVRYNSRSLMFTCSTEHQVQRLQSNYNKHAYKTYFMLLIVLCCSRSEHHSWAVTVVQCAFAVIVFDYSFRIGKISNHRAMITEMMKNELRLLCCRWPGRGNVECDQMFGKNGVCFGLYQSVREKKRGGKMCCWWHSMKCPGQTSPQATKLSNVELSIGTCRRRFFLFYCIF